MKKCVAWFVATLLAGAASAVTLGWTPKEDVTAFAGFTNAKGDLLGFKGDFTVTVTFAYSGTGLPSAYFKFLTANGALGQGALAMTNAGFGNRATITSYGDDTATVSKNTGGHYAADRLDGTRAFNGVKPMVNTLTLVFGGYDAETGVYGSSSHTITFASGPTETDSALGAGYDFGSDYIYWQGVELGEGVVLTGVAVEAGDVVPEPTALASLALGVALLALRRRVA